MRKTGNVLWIAPRDEINAKEKLELEAIGRLAEFGAIAYPVIPDELHQGLKRSRLPPLTGSGGGTRYSPVTEFASGSVISKSRTNQLFVTDIASKLEQVQQLIAKLDMPVRQVLIEARIVEASDTFGKSLGVKSAAVQLARPDGGVKVYQSGRQRTATPAVMAIACGRRCRHSGRLAALVNLPAIGQNGMTRPHLRLSIFNSAANRFLSLELSALEADGKGKVVSSPRVVTADQIKALIEQGTELPYQVATSSGATSIAFSKANLKLEVTPQITPEGNIILDAGRQQGHRGSVDRGRFCHQYQAHQDPGAGGEWRHGGDRRHFRVDRDRQRDQGARCSATCPASATCSRADPGCRTSRKCWYFITPKVVADKAAR
jgi:type IV pilus assembly protein PilQ